MIDNANIEQSDMGHTATDWSQFHSTDLAFVISYPSEWRAWQNERMLTIEPPNGNGAITVNVPHTGLPLDRAADISIQAALGDATPVNSRESVVINNVPGFAQTFIRDTETGKKLWLTLFLLKDGRFAAITANGPVSYMSKNHDVYQRIMRSFEFLTEQ